VTIVAFLGGLSAVMILTNPDNIGIDIANAEFNLEFNNATGVVDNANFTLPFNITNAGYFDLENFKLNIELAMNYSEIDYPVFGVNETRTRKIFEKAANFGTILKGSTGYFNFTGLFGNFTFGDFNITKIDVFKPPPLIEFYANFTISLDYSLGMHSITVDILNIKVYEINSIIP
jgi:hypothetical protein